MSLRDRRMGIRFGLSEGCSKGACSPRLALHWKKCHLPNNPPSCSGTPSMCCCHAFVLHCWRAAAPILAPPPQVYAEQMLPEPEELTLPMCWHQALLEQLQHPAIIQAAQAQQVGAGGKGFEAEAEAESGAEAEAGVEAGAELTAEFKPTYWRNSEGRGHT